MKLRTKLLVVGLTLGGISAAQANMAFIESDKLLSLTYRVVRQKEGKKPVLDPIQTISIDKKIPINFELAGYDYVGIVPVSIDNRTLPADVTEFNKPNRCSITTNDAKQTGRMMISVTNRRMTCKVGGGVFG